MQHRLGAVVSGSVGQQQGTQLSRSEAHCSDTPVDEAGLPETVDRSHSISGVTGVTGYRASGIGHRASGIGSVNVSLTGASTISALHPMDMIRRLSIFFGLALLVLPGPSIAQAPLDHRELPADQQILHALNRLTFGARPGDALEIRRSGLDNWVELQLNPKRIDDKAADQFMSRYTILNRDQNELLRAFNEAQRERRMARRDDTTERMPRQAMTDRPEQRTDGIALTRRAMINQLQSSRVARAVSSNRQLEEVLTDFWLNHFNVFAQKGPPQAYYLAEYDRDVIRS